MTLYKVRTFTDSLFHKCSLTFEKDFYSRRYINYTPTHYKCIFCHVKVPKFLFIGDIKHDHTTWSIIKEENLKRQYLEYEINIDV